MLSRLLEKFSKQDELERIAKKGNIRLLTDYLKTRRLFVPKKPRRFLDADSFIQEDLIELVKEEAEELERDNFELWILELESKKHLPAFSSQSRMQTFSEKMSRELNKVFSLGYVEVLAGDIVKQTNVDVLDLNLFSKESWEISVTDGGFY
jgi:hypothetical protein